MILKVTKEDSYPINLNRTTNELTEEKIPKHNINIDK